MNTVMNNTPVSEFLANHIRKINDWPKPGIIFHDITPVLQDALCFQMMIDALAYRHMRHDIDFIAGLDARGFIIGAALAYHLHAGFIPIRKAGKLPFDTVSTSYSLEYGEASVEIHTDALFPGARVLLVDDLIATGGTMQAGIRLIQSLKGDIVEALTLLEFTDLSGANNIRNSGIPLFSLCQSLAGG